MKIFLKILVISFIMCITFFYGYAEIVDMIDLEEKNIIDNDEIEVTVNNMQVFPLLAEHNDTLYIESDFLSACFENYERKMKDTPMYGAILKDKSGNEKEFLPVFLAFKAFKIPYSYTVIYGKAIIDIEITDGFNEDPSYAGDNRGNTEKAVNDITTAYPTVDYSPSPVYYTPPGYRDGSYFGDYGNPPVQYTDTTKSFGPTFGF